MYTYRLSLFSFLVPYWKNINIWRNCKWIFHWVFFILFWAFCKNWMKMWGRVLGPSKKELWSAASCLKGAQLCSQLQMSKCWIKSRELDRAYKKPVVLLRFLYCLCHLTIFADQLSVSARDFCKSGAILPISSDCGQKSLNTGLSFDLTMKSCQSIVTLPDSTSWVSIPGLEARLLDVDSVCRDGIFDPGPRKIITKSIGWDLPVTGAVGFTAVMGLGAFWILTTKLFVPVGINKIFRKLENICVLTPRRRCSSLAYVKAV